MPIAPSLLRDFFAAAETLHAAIAVPLSPAERLEHDRVVASVRAALGEPAFSGAWQAGAQLSVDAAIIEARNLVASEHRL